VASRKLLVKSIRDIQDGGEPPLVFRDLTSNASRGIVVLSEVIPDTVNVKEYVRELIEQSASGVRPSTRIGNG